MQKRVNSTRGLTDEADEERTALLAGSGPARDDGCSPAPPELQDAPEPREKPEDDRVCRICFDGEDPAEAHNNPLISPCQCAGGSRFIHRQCLAQWRDACKNSSREHAYYRCEVCKYAYRYERVARAAWIRHPVVVPTIFALLLLSSCFVLGFVPIVQACLGAFEVKYGGALLWVVHMIDGLLMLGLVCLGIQLLASQFGWDAYPACYFVPDCAGCAECGAAGGMDVGAAAGCGEICGPILLAALVTAAVIGLISVIPASLKWLYEKVDDMAGVAAHMVENVARPTSISATASPPISQDVSTAVAANRGQEAV